MDHAPSRSFQPFWQHSACCRGIAGDLSQATQRIRCQKKFPHEDMPLAALEFFEFRVDGARRTNSDGSSCGRTSARSPLFLSEMPCNCKPRLGNRQREIEVTLGARSADILDRPRAQRRESIPRTAEVAFFRRDL